MALSIQAMRRGNAISKPPFSNPSQIRLAASSTGMRKGIGKVFLSVKGVATKPGLTICIVTPEGSIANRRLSVMLMRAAFVAP